MILHFDLLPPSMNQLLRMHWAERARIKQNWVVLIRSKLDAPPDKPIAKCSILFVLGVKRRRDHDNAAAQFKIIGDALVAGGIIRNDSPACIEKFEVRKNLVGRSGTEYCEVHIWSD